MSWDEEEFACAALIVGVYMDDEDKKKINRSKWVQTYSTERDTKGSYGSLFWELSSESALFKQYMRIPLPTFQLLMDKIRPYIDRHDTHLLAAIPVRARLEATLLYLITGDHYSHLQIQTWISKASLSSIIPETCEAIYLALKSEYLNVSYFLSYCIFYCH